MQKTSKVLYHILRLEKFHSKTKGPMTDDISRRLKVRHFSVLIVRTIKKRLGRWSTLN